MSNPHASTGTSYWTSLQYLFIHVYIPAAITGLTASFSYHCLLQYQHRNKIRVRSHSSKNDDTNKDDEQVPQHSKRDLETAQEVGEVVPVATTPRTSNESNITNSGCTHSQQKSQGDAAADQIADRVLKESTLPMLTSSSIMNSVDTKFTQRQQQLRLNQAIPSTSSTTAATEKPMYKYLEILVHNVSHTDLVLGLDIPTKTHGGDDIILSSTATRPSTNGINEFESLLMKNYVRPRFSSFDFYCRLLFQHVLRNSDADDDDHSCHIDKGMVSNQTNNESTVQIIHSPVIIDRWWINDIRSCTYKLTYIHFW
jgi:hypothetical protein